MFTPAKMVEIDLIIHKNDMNAVLKAIVQQGTVQFVEQGTMDEWKKRYASSLDETSSLELTDINTRVQKLLGALDADLPRTVPPSKELKTINTKEADTYLTDLEQTVIALSDEKTELDTRLKALKEYDNRYGSLMHSDVFPYLARNFRLVETYIGTVPEEHLNAFTAELDSLLCVYEVIDNKADEPLTALYSVKKEKSRLIKIFKKYAFKKLSQSDLDSIKEYKDLKEFEDQISSLSAGIEEKEKALHKLRDEHAERLIDLYKRSLVSRLLYQAQKAFGTAGSIHFVSCWVPKKDCLSTIETIKKSAKGCCMMEVIDTDEIASVKKGLIEVPVKLENPSLLKPFELMVRTYGLPAYGSFDPTLIFAVSFCIMFGAMFGDLGQGLVLALIGLFIKREKSLKENVRLMGTLLAFCGMSSAVFGTLYGTLFGYEDILKPLWKNPMHNIMSFFAYAVTFGVFILSIGIVINIVTALKRRNFSSLFFEKTGLLAALIYWGTLGVILKSVLSKTPLNADLLLLFIFIPVILIFLRRPIERFVFRKKSHGHGLFLYLIETVVEIAEIFMTYVSNTISFVRVAAFSLSHAGLFIAIFSISNILRDLRFGIIWSLLAVIIGNILVLCLEGMVVFIQVLRLEYYEFFSKFFKTQRTEYDPIRLT